MAFVIIFALTTTIVLVRAYYVFSQMIDRKLAGEVFQNTARVYAAPLTLLPGQPIKSAAVIAYLRHAGYSETGKGPVRVGEYRLTKQTLEVIPNEEAFQGLAGGHAFIDFDDKGVKRIRSASDGKEIPSCELEPLLITNLFDKTREKRRLIEYDDIPKPLRDAVLSIEDRRFFEHSGFDPMGILRASVVDLFRWKRSQGASTITQQVVRSFWLTPERRVIRKLKEIYMSVILESRLTKKQIFTLYANDVYLGQRGTFSVNGFGEASTAYFNKDIKNLTIPEAAFIAGIIQSPNRYNPIRNPERALQRRNVVLQAMLDTGSINKDQFAQATKIPLNIANVSMDVSDAPYFVDVIKEQMLEKYTEKELLSQQYRIDTTLDIELQRIAYQAVRQGAENVDITLAKRRQRQVKLKKGESPPPLVIDPKDKVQSCLIALDPHTGEIRAFVGGRDYGTSQLNHNTTAKRQPGSVFKSFVMAAALNSALSPEPEPGSLTLTASTLVEDAPTVFEFDDKTYEPNNYGEKFYGPVTLRRTLTKSLNVATVKLAILTGLPKIVALAKAAGLNQKLSATPALALGAYEVTPLEVAEAYTIFANQGNRVSPLFIRSVTNSRGKVMAKNTSTPQTVLDPKIAYLMTNLMEGVINRGTAARARSLGFAAPAAGKTGTSHDGWFAGYTNGLLCIVWVGFDDNRELNLDGASSALPIWTEFMKKSIELEPWLGNSPFLPPEEGITSVEIDEETGLLAIPECQHTIHENYITGSEPKEHCSSMAHNWLAAQRRSLELNPSDTPIILEPGKVAPLNAPGSSESKPVNIFKRLFQKIF
ncbi:MAG: PBP1A family penicillin-binding protein [Terriglobia bacterium]